MLPQRTNASATILCLLMVVILNTVYGVEQESVQQLQMICSNKFVHIEPTGVVHANDSSDHPQTITIMSDISDLLQRPKTIPIKLFVKDVNMYLCYNKNWRLVGVEKRKLSSHRRCEFYEEENRGYFRFRSVDDADKYVSFFKGSGKPYHENQKRPKKVCSEFVKAHLQPVVNTQPVYHFPFDPMPRSPVPTPATIITTTVQTIISTTTTPVAPRTPTTVIRQTHKHRHNHKLVTQEFSSLDTRYHRVNKQLQPQQQQRPAPKGRHTKKKAPKRQQGQKHKQQQQKLAPTSPRSRNGGQTPKKHTQKQQSERREFSGIKFLDEQALEQERLRAYAVEEEKARKRKEERMADFAMVDDYWNDDNMIGSNDEVKWGRAKTFAKRHQASAIEKQVAPARTKHSKSHSILVKRLMGKGNSSSGSVVSGELKGHWRRKPQSLLPPKRQTALSKDNYTRNINNYPDSGSVISSKRHASLTHDRLNNHHHHPTEKSRRS